MKKLREKLFKKGIHNFTKPLINIHSSLISSKSSLNSQPEKFSFSNITDHTKIAMS